MPFRSGRIYDPSSPDDGVRLLTMRLWPRGIRKDRVTCWEKELGPSAELLGGFRRGEVAWEEFERRYVEEMRAKPDLLATWMERGREEDVTLLCGCKDESRCHRLLLKKLLQRQ